jgi:hypothetical protein
VRVGDDPAATTHEVTVSADALARYGGPRIDAQALVHESFAFLLERESRESILRRFELPAIASTSSQASAVTWPSGERGPRMPAR